MHKHPNTEAFCLAISQLDSTASRDEVEAILSPFLQSKNEHNVEATTDNLDDNHHTTSQHSVAITPFLVACDRGHVEACRYLLEQSYHDDDDDVSKNKRNIIGSVTQQAPETGNTSVHHAAMSGSVQVMELLLRDCMKRQQNKHVLVDPQPEEDATILHVSSVEELASLTNAHGDTPLMMAAIVSRRHDNNEGNNEFNSELIKWFAEHLKQPVVCHGGSVHDENNSSTDRIWKMRNASNDSALSLASGHGNVQAIRSILRFHPNAVEDEDLRLAQASVQRLDKLLTMKEQPQQSAPTTADQNVAVAQMQQKKLEIQQCVELLETALQQKADRAAQELLRWSEDDAKETNGSSAKNNLTTATRNVTQKKNRKKKNKKRLSNQDNIMKQEEEATITSGSNNQPDPSEAPQFTTLRDGTRAVAVVGRSPNEEEIEQPNKVLPSPTIQTKTVDELFCDLQTTLATDHEKECTATGVDNALCLSASQLLLSPHNMALTLSASQLDAVERILERQLAAVQTAREIQASRRRGNEAG